MFKKNQIRAQRFINTITENFQSSKKKLAFMDETTD